jgi:hypothetical protein
MPLRPLLPAVLLALLLSTLVGVLAAGRGSGLTLGIAMALFGAQVVVTLFRINAPVWHGETAADDTDWAWSNTVLAALVYAWAATAMFALYSLTGLYWQHWWQYGLAMALFAAAAFFFAAYLLGGHGPIPRAQALRILMVVTAAQAAAIIVGLVWLFTSDKLYSGKQDWAANHVFVSGGIVLAIISIVSLLSYKRYLEAAPPPPPAA